MKGGSKKNLRKYFLNYHVPNSLKRITRRFRFKKSKDDVNYDKIIEIIYKKFAIQIVNGIKNDNSIDNDNKIIEYKQLINSYDKIIDEEEKKEKKSRYIIEENNILNTLKENFKNFIIELNIKKEIETEIFNKLNNQSIYEELLLKIVYYLEYEVKYNNTKELKLSLNDETYLNHYIAPVSFSKKESEPINPDDSSGTIQTEESSVPTEESKTKNNNSYDNEYDEMVKCVIHNNNTSENSNPFFKKLINTAIKDFIYFFDKQKVIVINDEIVNDLLTEFKLVDCKSNKLQTKIKYFYYYFGFYTYLYDQNKFNKIVIYLVNKQEYTLHITDVYFLVKLLSQIKKIPVKMDMEIFYFYFPKDAERVEFFRDKILQDFDEKPFIIDFSLVTNNSGGSYKRRRKHTIKKSINK
jgi:hypothetical protein